MTAIAVSVLQHWHWHRARNSICVHSTQRPGTTIAQWQPPGVSAECVCWDRTGQDLSSVEGIGSKVGVLPGTQLGPDSVGKL